MYVIFQRAEVFSSRDYRMKNVIMRKRKGFTLIEHLVVIAVIVLLLAILTVEPEFKWRISR